MYSNFLWFWNVCIIKFRPRLRGKLLSKCTKLIFFLLVLFKSYVKQMQWPNCIQHTNVPWTIFFLFAKCSLWLSWNTLIFFCNEQFMLLKLRMLTIDWSCHWFSSLNMIPPNLQGWLESVLYNGNVMNWK